MIFADVNTTKDPVGPLPDPQSDFSSQATMDRLADRHLDCLSGRVILASGGFLSGVVP